MQCPFSTSHIPLTITGLESVIASRTDIERLSNLDGNISAFAPLIPSNLSSSVTNPRLIISGCLGISHTAFPISTSLRSLFLFLFLYSIKYLNNLGQSLPSSILPT